MQEIEFSTALPLQRLHCFFLFIPLVWGNCVVHEIKYECIVVSENVSAYVAVSMFFYLLTRLFYFYNSNVLVFLPRVLTVITLLSIPSPRAFFPTTWNSYTVPGDNRFIVTVVLPDGVTGIVVHSEVPASLNL